MVYRRQKKTGRAQTGDLFMAFVACYHGASAWHGKRFDKHGQRRGQAATAFSLLCIYSFSAGDVSVFWDLNMAFGLNRQGQVVGHLLSLLESVLIPLCAARTPLTTCTRAFLPLVCFFFFAHARTAFNKTFYNICTPSLSHTVTSSILCMYFAEEHRKTSFHSPS